LTKHGVDGFGTRRRNVHGKVPGDGEELFLLSHKPSLQTELNQNADASLVTVALNETMMRIHEV
jgi:hypothetical protein